MYQNGAWRQALGEVGPRLLDDLYALVGVRFETVAVQGYLDGSADTSWHSDSPFDVQAILSLGATRTFGVSDSTGHDAQFVSLDSGDLIVMPSGFQNTMQHCIVAEPQITEERCSLVFRTIRREPCTS